MFGKIINNFISSLGVTNDHNLQCNSHISASVVSTENGNYPVTISVRINAAKDGNLYNTRRYLNENKGRTRKCIILLL